MTLHANALPADFLTMPIAHRGYHDRSSGRPENSLAAFRQAVAAGYAIELDVQASRDIRPMVFHDYDLKRLTGTDGLIQSRTASDIAALTLMGGSESVPSLSDVLKLVSGRVPLLVELKDQDGALGANVGPLEQAVARELAEYAGPVALMSFNPHSVAALGTFAPHLPRGLVTGSFESPASARIAASRRAELREIADFDRVRASFISHQASDLARPRVVDLKQSGVPVLCWTVRSVEQEARAREVADNITFEGYAPARPMA
ncbi:MAG: glycerophosphodiester phosphodiesterase family protein [Halocynthiibacter sp.]